MLLIKNDPIWRTFMKKQTVLFSLLCLVLALLFVGCGEEKIPAIFENAIDHHAVVGTLTGDGRFRQE